jgi:hypothetical protein
MTTRALRKKALPHWSLSHDAHILHVKSWLVSIAQRLLGDAQQVPDRFVVYLTCGPPMTVSCYPDVPLARLRAHLEIGYPQ